MIINCMHGGWHKVKDLLSEIESYWTTRAEGYSEINHKELNGMQKGAWLEVLKGQFPEKAKDEIKILDIGTGPGFFPVILAEAGYKVTAVDYTQEMLDTAKRNAGNLCERISFYKMDAQNLEFEDDVFDVVISRNLTWNLKDPKRAYEEWCRVLKPGGKLLNFDANWYGYLYDEEKRLSYEEDRKSVESEHLDDHYLCTDIDRMEKIALQISQSNFKLNEAYKKLSMAKKNVEKAEENLRCANVGFKEGVLQTTDVMEAQTAWMQAQSQKIDAEVGVKLSQVNVKKALGILN